MIIKIKYILRFIRSSFKTNGFYASKSFALNKAAKHCISNISYIGRDDLREEHFQEFVAHILGIFSCIVSYQESISFLCLSGHALNSSILLRSQLESRLIFHYLIAEKKDIEETKKRVNEYLDWVMIKMYNNSKKSKDFDLFTISPHHADYLKNVAENYQMVKRKYTDNPQKFKRLNDSQSFLPNKRQIAKDCDIEDLYLGIFSETSATTHLADISDRVIMNIENGHEHVTIKFSSDNESMFISGVSNIMLISAIGDFMDYFEFSKEHKKKIFKNSKLTKKHFA